MSIALCLFLGGSLMAIIATMVVLSLRRIVPTNEVHVVRKNKETFLYGGNFEHTKGNIYYEFPEWVPGLGVSVTKLRTDVFRVTLPAYDAYDKDRLPFIIDVQSFFRVGDPLVAASRIQNQAKLEEQLLGIVQGAARSILAKEDLNTIMGERNKYGEQFTKEVSPQLEQWGVTPVKNIELMDIRDARDSNVILNIMAKKKSAIEMESRCEVAANMKAASEAEILAKQEIELKQQEANKAIGLRKAQVEQEVGIAQEKARQEVQEQAKVTTEKEMAVKQVQEVQAAEIEKQAEIVKAEAAQNVAEIQAKESIARMEGNKKVTVLEAEANKQKIELQAEADLTAAKNKAVGIEATGKAEAKALELKKEADVAGNIKQAKEIGGNKNYQEFIIAQEQVKANAQVGIEQAKNLGNANIQMYISGGDVAEGVANTGKLFTPTKGLNIGSALEALSSTSAGKKLLNDVGSFLNKGNDNTGAEE